MKRSLLFILVIIVAITVALFVGKMFTKGGKDASVSDCVRSQAAGRWSGQRNSGA